MRKLNNNGQSLTDNWQMIDTAEIDPRSIVEPVIVPLAFFLENSEALKGKQVGVWLDAADSAQSLTEHVHEIPLIAINFPVFADGRGFSHARSLRDHMGYRGELLAVGNYMQDQLYYLKRCGFDSYAIDDTANVESMAHSLADFSHTYQAAADQPLPIYRRRA